MFRGESSSCISYKTKFRSVQNTDQELSNKFRPRMRCYSMLSKTRSDQIQSSELFPASITAQFASLQMDGTAAHCAITTQDERTNFPILYRSYKGDRRLPDPLYASSLIGRDAP